MKSFIVLAVLVLTSSTALCERRMELVYHEEKDIYVDRVCKATSGEGSVEEQMANALRALDSVVAEKFKEISKVSYCNFTSFSDLSGIDSQLKSALSDVAMPTIDNKVLACGRVRIYCSTDRYRKKRGKIDQWFADHS